MQPQACFDELIAHSNRVLDHGFNYQDLGNALSEDQINEGWHRTSLSSKPTIHEMGIDDFLSRYRHQQSSIREFFSCLDEPSATFKSEPNSNDALCDFEDKCAAVSLAEFKIDDRKCIVSEGIPCKGMQESKKHAQIESRVYKRRKKLTSLEREERRRDQNREAQRRYREKHMLQSSLQSRHGFQSYSWNRSAVSSQASPWGYQ